MINKKLVEEVKEAKFQAKKIKEIVDECIAKGLVLRNNEGYCLLGEDRFKYYRCPHVINYDGYNFCIYKKEVPHENATI